MNLWPTNGQLTEWRTVDAIERLLVCEPPAGRLSLEFLVRPLQFEVACGVDVVGRALARWDDDAELAAALLAAPWGPQPGGGFVTVQSCWPSPGQTRAYHAPHKRGVLARATLERGVWWVERWTPREAWTRRQVVRRERDSRHLAYLAALRVTAAALASGQRLERTPGQLGGTVRVPGGGVRGVEWVSARGAERLAAELETVDARRVSRRRPADARRALCEGA